MFGCRRRTWPSLEAQFVSAADFKKIKINKIKAESSSKNFLLFYWWRSAGPLKLLWRFRNLQQVLTQKLQKRSTNMNLVSFNPTSVNSSIHYWRLSVDSYWPHVKYSSCATDFNIQTEIFVLLTKGKNFSWVINHLNINMCVCLSPVVVHRTACGGRCCWNIADKRPDRFKVWINTVWSETRSHQRQQTQFYCSNRRRKDEASLKEQSRGNVCKAENVCF